MRAVQFGPEDVGALCSMLGAHGASSVTGLSAGTGTGADGSGMHRNFAVLRHAGSSNVSSSAIVRLPKAVAMFASRSCRHSIMIGTALSHAEMETVVKKMVDVEQPWNCPHGRPTLKHVSELLGVLTGDEAIVQEIWAPTGVGLSQLT